jgi:hypothetical protein
MDTTTGGNGELCIEDGGITVWRKILKKRYSTRKTFFVFQIKFKPLRFSDLSVIMIN